MLVDCDMARVLNYSFGRFGSPMECAERSGGEMQRRRPPRCSASYRRLRYERSGVLAL